MDYTSPFLKKKKKKRAYRLYHNIKIKLIIDDRKFVVLVTICFLESGFPRSYEGFIYKIHSSTTYTKLLLHSAKKHTHTHTQKHKKLL